MKNKKLFAILTLVCFMMTLMPVAAFAADPATVSGSYISTDAKDQRMTKNEVDDAFYFDFNGDVNATTVVYVWAEKNGVVSTDFALATAGTNDTYTKEAYFGKTPGVFAITGPVDEKLYTAVFEGTGEYTIKAAMDDADGAVAEVLEQASTTKTTSQKIAAIADYKLANVDNYKTITVKATNTSASDYVAEITANNTKTVDKTEEKVDETFVNGVATVKDAEKVGNIVLDANSLDNATVKVKLMASATDNTAIKQQDVKIESSSTALEVSDEKLTTDVRGMVEFDVTATVEGTYYVDITAGGYDARIQVVVTAAREAYIETVKEPSSPVNMELDNDTLAGLVEFDITDINGNTVKEAVSYLKNNDKVNGTNNHYIKFVSKPAASDLEDEDLTMGYSEAYGHFLNVDGSFDAEGTYVMKVTLDNGKSATVTVEAKEFQTPVKLLLTYKQEAVELGGEAVVNTLRYVDANGVTKAANDAEIAATGYAIAKVYTIADKNTDGTIAHKKGNVVVKTDEKYIGSEITVTAVSERYDLVATATIKVTSDAAELAFASKTAEVNVNNKIDVQIVDSEGNKVAPSNIKKAEISYVVLDKPEGAKVSVTTASDKDLKTKGLFTMSLTSNKIGNVAVQAIAKLEPNDNKDNSSSVVKYYTGTQIFAVGNGSVGDVVVMSINSNEIVINDAKATIDAAPIVKNDRTFVPFRALAEAFGAEVAYDEATQAVTAELNGVKVVMTIGSATYTVNGAEKTMDVAPFINGSRTMVPVRFVAEAFGIKVIPTYDENGATADILFNL